MVSERPIRILLAKVGLDGHDRGVKVLAAMLRNEGYEVVYLGLYNTPEMVVQSAMQEDVDVVGISYLSGEHLTMTPRLMRALRERDLEHVPVIVGGIIPPQDEGELLKAGVKRVFRGSLVREVVEFLENYFATHD